MHMGPAGAPRSFPRSEGNRSQGQGPATVPLTTCPSPRALHHVPIAMSLCAHTLGVGWPLTGATAVCCTFLAAHPNPKVITRCVHDIYMCTEHYHLSKQYHANIGI